MRKILFYIIIVSIFSSCRTLDSSKMFDTPRSYDYSEFKPLVKEYTIKPFDELDVKVYTNKGDKLIDFENTNFQQQKGGITYNVEHDGKVKLPTLNRINLSGLTKREAEEKLENEYKKYFRDPFVILSIVNRRVIVFSSGSTKGQVISMKNDNFTLIEALAEAGGISGFSKAYKIKLLRGDLNNPEVFLFKLRKLEDMKNVNFLLRSNDIIYVEEKPRYASKFLVEVAPYLTLFTTMLTIYAIIK